MSEVIFFVGPVVAFSLLAGLYGNRKWKQVAAELGLEFSRQIFGARRVRGSLRGFGVQIAERSDGQKNSKPVCEVYDVDPGFTLGREGLLLRRISPDIQTGDVTFDRQVRIEGDADRALAVLSDKARRLVSFVVVESEGTLKRQVLRTSVADVQQAGHALGKALDLAELLRRPTVKEIPLLLAERALTDASRGVRLQAFRQLSSSFPSIDRTLATAEKLLDAPYAALRLEACRVLLKTTKKLDSQAAEVLVDLVTRRRVDVATRLSALETLGGSRYREEAIAAMVGVLRRLDEPSALRGAALDGLIRSRAGEELLEVRPDGPAESETLARGLGRLGARAQPKLLQLLEHSEESVCRAAIASLERVGDLEAIAPLRRIAGTESLFRSATSRAAENAIHEIKGRAGGSQRGEISLARLEPLEGAVSEVEESDTGGEISLTP